MWYSNTKPLTVARTKHTPATISHGSHIAIPTAVTDAYSAIINGHQLCGG